MKVFHCDHCGQLLFYENTVCVKCGHTLAYLPSLGVVASLDPVEASPGHYTSPLPRAAGKTFKLCRNYLEHHTCNWGMDADDPHELCLSCRLTRTIPDLSKPEHHEAWAKLETAKRRLVYTLQRLGLPVISKHEDELAGLRFDFLADPDDPGAPRVMTGHQAGIITMALAEADDAERERRRVEQREPYRTVVGHFRHEVGHYYWALLIDQQWRANPPERLTRFRGTFGDERADYGEALNRHYQQGPPADWNTEYISAYATMHPWEDFAETWAHYLHMVDTLETAASNGLALLPHRDDEPTVPQVADPFADSPPDFDTMLDQWTGLTFALNNLNRGMGVPDAYPFVIPRAAREKLRFVHGVVGEVAAGGLA